MKKLVYRLINRLGYNVYKKNRKKIDAVEKARGYELPAHFNLLVGSYYYLCILEKRFKNLKLADAGDFLKVSFNNLEFHLESVEEFLILKEIFVDEEYNFDIAEKCVLIDIGANVGMASVFFSKVKNVHKIYAYEPVKDTYEIAQKNLRANHITNVSLHNFGLGREQREESFMYSRQLKGNSGVRGGSNPFYEQLKGVEERTVQLRKASEVLKPVIAENLGAYKIVVKIDCEGAEYEILKNFEEDNILSYIDIIIIEWHDRGAVTIQNLLTAGGFAIFSKKLGPVSGMIYGVKF